MIRIGGGFLYGSGGKCPNRGESLRKIFLMCAGIAVLTGCSKVSHIDQLLTLKGLADEQVEMNKYVAEQDQKFEQMLKEYKAGTLGTYLSKGKIVRTFGEPIYKKNIFDGNQSFERWLYRYETRFFGSEKIYMYFDADENVVKTEYVGGSHGEIGEEAAQEVEL